MASSATQEQGRNPHVVFILLAILVAIVFGIGLRSIHLNDVTSRSPDEKVYTYYAKQIVDRGIAVIPDLYFQYVTQKEFWDVPPPTRITTVGLDAVVMKIWGVRDERAGVLISWLSSCCSLVLLAWIGVRFFNPWIALAAVVFMTFSLIDLAMARRAWQDANFGFLSLVLVYVTCEIAATPNRIFWYPAFFITGMLGLLTKQSGLITYGLCGLWLIWLFANARAWNLVAWLAIGGIVSVALSMAVWVAAAGDTSLALFALERSFNPGENAAHYAATIMSARWYQFIAVLLALNPFAFLTALFGAAASFHCPIRQPAQINDEKAARFMALFTVSIIAFFALFPAGQDLRLIAPATGPYYLLVGTGVYYLTMIGMELTGMFAIVLLVLTPLLAFISIESEYRLFNSTVVAVGMQDLPASLFWQRLKVSIRHSIRSALPPNSAR